MSTRHEFEFGTIRGQPKGSPRWVFRCKCGVAECEATFIGPYRTAREAERAACALAREAERIAASLVDGGNAQH
jgi:hypothetical protein